MNAKIPNSVAILKALVSGDSAPLVFIESTSSGVNRNIRDMILVESLGETKVLCMKDYWGEGRHAPINDLTLTGFIAACDRLTDEEMGIFIANQTLRVIRQNESKDRS